MSQPFHPAYFAVRFRTDGPVAVWPRSFAIITAYATTGEQWSEARNREADAALLAELLERGCAPIRTTGYDPDSGHAEPGWAVDLPLDEALALGQSYRQDAIFHVEGDALVVCACAPDGPSASMGGFRERLDPGIADASTAST